MIIDRELVVALGELNDEGVVYSHKHGSDIYQNITGDKVKATNFRKYYTKYKDKVNPKVKNDYKVEIVANKLGVGNNVNNMDRPFKKEIEKNSDGSVGIKKLIWSNEEMINDEKEILNALGYNPVKFKLGKFRASEWEQNSNKDGLKTLYAVQSTVIPREEPQYDLESFIDFYDNYKRTAIEPIVVSKPNNQKELNKDVIIECPAIELHLGKFSWRDVTGFDYDKDIAIYRFKKIVQDIIEEQQIVKADTLYFGMGNDFFNSDTFDHTTTGGTPQHNDMRWEKMFTIGLDLMLWAIDEFSKHFNNVEVKRVAGNHDRQTTFYLLMAIGMYHKGANTPNVNIDLNAKEIQVIEFGINMIVWHHGDKNNKRLMQSVAVEFPEIWGRTVVRELHCGHLHKERAMIDEEGGVTLRRIPSPSNPDYWHYSERFIGSKQGHVFYVFHRHEGIKRMNFCSFVMER